MHYNKRWRGQTLSDMMWSCKCFPHVSKIRTLTYSRTKSDIIKNAIISNIMHNSNMTFFKRFEFKPVVNIIFSYDVI
jgi:hypothetical protein